MLGEKLKKAISDSGCEPEVAAVALGVSRSTLYNLYKKRDIGTEVLHKASELTGVSMDYWFKSESKNPDYTDNKRPTAKEDSYLFKYIAKLEKENEEKDQTIRFQQREIELLLGKSKVVPKGRFGALFFAKRVQKRVQPISMSC